MLAVSIFTVTGLVKAMTLFVAAVDPTEMPAPTKAPTVDPARRPVSVVFAFATESLHPTMMKLPDSDVVTGELPTEAVELMR